LVELSIPGCPAFVSTAGLPGAPSEVAVGASDLVFFLLEVLPASWTGAFVAEVVDMMRFGIERFLRTDEVCGVPFVATIHDY
jgi:hypothetical protein